MQPIQDMNKEIFLTDIQGYKSIINIRGIARKIGVHSNTVSNYVNGNFSIGDPKIMVKILDECKATAKQLKETLLKVGI